jgi:hypothetical protein
MGAQAKRSKVLRRGTELDRLALAISTAGRLAQQAAHRFNPVLANGWGVNRGRRA